MSSVQLRFYADCVNSSSGRAIVLHCVLFLAGSPSGKAQDFLEGRQVVKGMVSAPNSQVQILPSRPDSCMRWFESSTGCHINII